MKVPKRRINWMILITILLLVILINNLKSIEELHQSIGKIQDSKLKIDSLIADKDRLNENINYAQTEEYLEKVAIEQLNLTKPGYTVVIVDENTMQKPANQAPQVATTKTQPNWQLWIKAFKISKN